MTSPKKEGVEVKAENIDERPAQERNESPKTKEDPIPEKEEPTKEEAQTVNPTMARTSRDPASGQDSDKRSTKGEKLMPLEDPEKKPSVREKLKECKKISDEKQAAKELARTVQNVLPTKKSDPR